MEELEYFKKTLESQIRKALNGGFVLLPFMDLTYGSIIEEYANRYKIPFYKWFLGIILIEN